MTGPAAARRPLVRSGLVIAVAMGFMNVTTYGFTIVAARVLGPVEYGALAAVMGLLLVLNVLSLGLQATGARRIAADPDRRAETEAEVMRTTYRCASALGLLSLVAAPLVSGLLELDSWTVAALIAVTAVPTTVMGGQAGILQGERRWTPLALVYLSVGLGRLGIGAVTLAVRPDTLGAMAGVALGAFAPVCVGLWALRHPSRLEPKADDPLAPTPSPATEDDVLRETMHSSHALLAFFALSNVDVVAARIVLDEHQAGLYAGGLILAKAVLFLPQFVVVIVFPSMSSARSSRRTNLLALGAVTAIGLVTALATAALPGLTTTFIGGEQYSEIAGHLWAFAGLGTVLAMLQLMVYNVVARRRQRAVYAIWGALVVVAAVATTASMSVTTLLVTVVTVDAALLAVLLLLAARRSFTLERPPDRGAPADTR